jgi:hypothetical protein
MSEDIKDAIISISKGKSTRTKIGSRAVPHRLRQDERISVARALELGFLEIYPWSRDNSSNIYKKMCLSLQKRPLFCTHEKSQSIIWYEITTEKEILPEELLSNQYYYLIKEKIMNIYLKDRKSAKILAKTLSLRLN